MLLRWSGYGLVAAGVVALLVAGYLLFGTSVLAQQDQDDAAAELHEAWRDSAAGQRPTPAVGEPFAKIAIPRFGDDHRFVVSEGTEPTELASGPGHYPGTAMPGEPGNFAVAGQRIGHGAPFGDLDELEACDPIVVETARDYFVYRVLPMADQADDWRQTRSADPRCSGVSSLRHPDRSGGGPYRDTVGRKIVAAEHELAVAAVPYRPPDTLDTAHRAAVATLTTTHPRYGGDRRLVVHAVLTDQIGKAGRDDYQQLLRQIGEA